MKCLNILFLLLSCSCATNTDWATGAGNVQYDRQLYANDQSHHGRPATQLDSPESWSWNSTSSPWK